MFIATLPPSDDSGTPVYGVGNSEEEAVKFLRLEYVTPWFNRSEEWGKHAEYVFDLAMQEERIQVSEIHGVDIIHNPN